MHHTIVRLAGWLRTRSRLGRIALALCPNVKWTVTIPEIGPLRIRLRTHRSFWLRNPIDLERTMFGALQKLVAPGDVCYDVGANIGLYTRFLVTVFHAGQVVSFEPMSDNFKLLQTNASVDPNAAQKIKLYEIALADSDGHELLQVDDVMSASAVLDRVTGGSPSQGRRIYGLKPKTEKVTLAKLDTIIAAQTLSPPNVIKIDIEGAESLMLKGAVETLKKYRPRLAIELHRLDVTRGVLQLLDELGYHCFATIPENGHPVYRQIHASDTENRKSKFDIHFIFCSTTLADVQTPLPDYRP